MARQISIRALWRTRLREAAPRLAPSPRFESRVLVASFVSVFGVLAALSTVLVVQTRAFVERSATADLEAAQRQLAAGDRERHEDAVLRGTLIAVNQDLKRLLEAYQDGRASGEDVASTGAQLDLLQRKIRPVAQVLRADVMAILGWDGRVVASAGARAADWVPGLRVLDAAALDAGATEALVRAPAGLFAATVAPIAMDGMRVGHLVEARALDAGYAASLAGDTPSSVVVMLEGQSLASTAPPAVTPALAASLAHVTAASGTIEADGCRYAYLRLRRIGPASAYAVASITAGRDRLVASALPTLGVIGAGALLLCALSSLWLAERVAAPIDQVSRDIQAMVDAPGSSTLVVATPSIQELDLLTASFNRLIGSLRESRLETDAAYVGAIGALAAALDARDPYTAGHSERVSALSVEIGRELGLDADAIDVLRLGALLHDVGKIGITDAILGKPSPLTDAEFEAIKCHTVLGAHILQPVGFLHPHIPIVELHHERLDGGGYPHGLRGDEIPLPARIVHVADAYDAMTTSRAYRTGFTPEDALAELDRNAGTDFDSAALAALARVLNRARQAA